MSMMMLIGPPGLGIHLGNLPYKDNGLQATAETAAVATVFEIVPSTLTHYSFVPGADAALMQTGGRA